MRGRGEENAGWGRKRSTQCLVLTSQWDTIESEPDIEASIWRWFEGDMKANSDITEANFMHETLITFASRVCARGLYFNLIP